MIVGLPEATDTRALGARLAHALPAARGAPLLIALSGELGAGKTTFVSGLLAALGHQGPVRSPTYTLVEPYTQDGREILHCDLYRLETPDAIDDLGVLDEITDSNVLLIEWPERAASRLPPPDLEFRFSYAAEGRRVELRASGEQGARVIAALGLDQA